MHKRAIRDNCENCENVFHAKIRCYTGFNSISITEKS